MMRFQARSESWGSNPSSRILPISRRWSVALSLQDVFRNLAVPKQALAGLPSHRPLRLDCQVEKSIAVARQRAQAKVLQPAPEGMRTFPCKADPVSSVESDAAS